MEDPGDTDIAGSRLFSNHAYAPVKISKAAERTGLYWTVLIANAEDWEVPKDDKYIHI